MSKKQHNKQVARARAKRQRSKYDRRAARNKVIIIVMAVLMALSLVAASLAALVTGDDDPEVEIDDPPDTEDPTEEPEAVEGPCPSADEQDVPEATDERYDEPPRFELADDATYVVTLHTTCGDVEVELDTDGAPRSAENVLALADDGFYAGTPFHRVIDGFMIQGGDPTGTGTGGPGYELDDELDVAESFEPFELPEEELEGLTEEQLEQLEGLVEYPRGTVAMANSGADTQGSQFFIVQENSELEPVYTVIGEVVDGMDVVDDIAAGPVGGEQALDPVYITEVTIDER